jgi:hypothetical protein
MPEINAAQGFVEVAFSDRALQVVPLTELPFLIGRGKESGNHLAFDDMRISRKCASITAGSAGLQIEDRGQLNGIFVNGELTKGRVLSDGDRIRLGVDEGCQLVFRLHSEPQSPENAETKLRSLLGSWGGNSADELKGLRLLLEATQLLHSQLPLNRCWLRCSITPSPSPMPTVGCFSSPMPLVSCRSEWRAGGMPRRSHLKR